MTIEQSGATQVSAAAIEEWLIEQLSGYLSLDPDEIDPEEPFASYKMDSAVSVSLTEKLATWLNVDLEPTFLWEYPTIAAVAEHLDEG